MDKIERLKGILSDIPDAHGNLKKEGATSLCGPCPKCGGVDRFVYKIDSRRFWCRQCNEKGGDLLDFHGWMESTDIKGLIEKYLPDSDDRPFAQQGKPFVHFKLGEPVEKYQYTDGNGKILYWNCRFYPKTFRQCNPPGLKWTVKHIKLKVPYQLQKVRGSATVFINGGEKACNRMNDIDQVGTCNVAGEGNWTPDLNQHFKGKKVILIPDNDDKGRSHVERVYNELKGVASSIKLLELPGLPDGGDFADWFESFDDPETAAERLAIMVENAGPYKPKKSENESKIEIISVESMADMEIEDNPIIDGLLCEKESLIISGASGVGKSLFVNHIALSLGNPPEGDLWRLFNVPKMVKTLIIQSENSLNAQAKRYRKLFDAHPEMQPGAKNVFMVKAGDDCRIAGSLTDSDFQKFLIDSLLSIDAGLLILDPLISYHGEDENDNAAMRRSLDCLTLVCDKANVSVILAHHYNRQNLTRGAASIRDWTANMILMDFEKKESDSTILKITHDKSRNYEQQPDFYLERTPDLQFLRCEKPGGKFFNQVDAVVSALTEMGGMVNNQAHLKNAVMVELNCSEASARRAINKALELRKIIIIPGIGAGNPNCYKLSEQI